MKLRQAKKIMKNVRYRAGMIWVYGSGRVGIANRMCIQHYARTAPIIRKWNILTDKDPMEAIKILHAIMAD